MTDVLIRKRRDSKDAHGQRKDHVRTLGEGSHLQFKEASEENRLISAFDLELLALRTMRK